MVRTAALALALLATAAQAESVTDSAQKQLADRLVDGESARWRWWPAKQSPDGTVELCGFLNSKNRLGGYTGFTPVWVAGRMVDGRFVISGAEIARGPYLDGVAAKRCLAAGFSMTTMPPPN
jgi:hypothetical protein